MKTKEQRYSELYNSGLVNSIKGLFANKNVHITEDYYVLMADYIDSLDVAKDEMIIDPAEIAKMLPQLVSNIQEGNLGGIYGITDKNGIRIEQSLDYNQKKLYFFHELTHALQTTNENGKEQCAFYDGHTGMFLTEAATQYTAEMLYNISNGTNMQHREQLGVVRGQSDRTPYSPLSEYQYNGDILELLCKTMDLPLPQVLSLAYKRNGRETLKSIYESMDGNEGKFDELMLDLEKIYSIDNLLINGYGQQLQSQIPLTISMQDRETSFKGNMNIYRQLMDKTERELVASFIENHDTEYILQNCNDIARYLTTPELKNNFMLVIKQLSVERLQNNVININDYRRNRPQTNEIREEISQGYSINEYGEIIRPTRQEQQSKQEIGMSDGFSINEYGEIIRPARNQEQTKTGEQDITQTQGIKNTRFGAVISPNRYNEQFNSNINQNENKLTLKQKVAQFLQRNNIFMNLSFVGNFVHKQLDVLPEATQEKRIETIKTRQNNFIDELTGDGVYRKLPPIQRMSNPQKIEEMRRKREQHQENEKG